MNPYRQPQKLDERPADPTRIVLIIAGVVAALIAVAAIAVGVSERLTKDERAMTTVRPPPPTPTPTPIIPTPDIVKRAPQRPPRALPAEGPLSFMTGVVGCVGDCVQHSTWITEDGRISIYIGPERAVCAAVEGHKVSAADLAALGTQARSMQMERMQWSYTHNTHDVLTLLTKVMTSDDQLVSYHHDVDSSGADASVEDQQHAALASLHRHIEKVAGTAKWLKICKR